MDRYSHEDDGQNDGQKGDAEELARLKANLWVTVGLGGCGCAIATVVLAVLVAILGLLALRGGGL